MAGRWSLSVLKHGQEPRIKIRDPVDGQKLFVFKSFQGNSRKLFLLPFISDDLIIGKPKAFHSLIDLMDGRDRQDQSFSLIDPAVELIFRIGIAGHGKIDAALSQGFFQVRRVTVLCDGKLDAGIFWGKAFHQRRQDIAAEVGGGADGDPPP